MTVGHDVIRALLVLEHDVLLSTTELAFRHGGFAHRSERTLRGARNAIAEWQPHVILLDIGLGSGSAMQLIGEVRSVSSIGLIALTRRSDLSEEVDALERGADDYISMPFVPGDLIARTRAVLRRSHVTPGALAARHQVGDLQMSVSGRILSVSGSEVRLTSLDQALLYVLVANAGRTLTRSQILDAVWGAEFVAQSNLVDKHVRALRQKLKDDRQHPRYIETVAGVGYRFLLKPDPE